MLKSDGDFLTFLTFSSRPSEQDAVGEKDPVAFSPTHNVYPRCEKDPVTFSPVKIGEKDPVTFSPFGTGE